MRARSWKSAGPVVTTLLVLGIFSLAHGAGAGRGLPPKAAEAVKAAFPKAVITGIGREREHGVMYYEVNLGQNGQRIEVEVTADGVIGESEAKLRMEDLPKDVRKIVTKATKGAKGIRIERHERRARAEAGRFVPLARATVRYEVKYYLGGRRRRLWLDAKAIGKLPEKAKLAIKKMFPKATIKDVELEYEHGVKLYEVELAESGRLMEVKLSSRGAVVEVATRLSMRNVPKLAAETIRKHSKGARVKEIEKVEVQVVVKSGKLVKLRKPRTFFEAEVLKGGKEAEIKVSPDGKLLEPLKWENIEDDEDDDEDDDDENDDE